MTEKEKDVIFTNYWCYSNRPMSVWNTDLLFKKRLQTSFLMRQRQFLARSALLRIRRSAANWLKNFSFVGVSSRLFTRISRRLPKSWIILIFFRFCRNLIFVINPKKTNGNDKKCQTWPNIIKHRKALWNGNWHLGWQEWWSGEISPGTAFFTVFLERWQKMSYSNA